MEDLVQQIGLPLIAVLVPLVVGLFKKIVPDIPKWLLPVLAAVLGPAFDLGIAALSGAEFNGIAGVLAGLAGVGLREVKDQAIKALPNA